MIKTCNVFRSQKQLIQEKRVKKKERGMKQNGDFEMPVVSRKIIQQKRATKYKSGIMVFLKCINS